MRPPPSVDIDVQVAGVDAAAVAADAEWLLRRLDLASSELSIVLCDDAFIRPLNHSYRQRDTATDVLSFAMQEGDSLLDDDPVLGDLVISVETARRQAREVGHSVQDELRVLLVHGLLHLLGYDHERGEADAAEMSSAEGRLLNEMGAKQGLIARSES